MPQSAHGLDLPIFLDTGDPRFGRPVPELRRRFRIFDFASDIDPGPGRSFWTFGWSLSWPTCAVFLTMLIVLVAACRTAPLRPDVCLHSPRVGLPVSRGILLGHAHVSPVLPGRDSTRYIIHGFGRSTSHRTCLVTGSLLFAAPVHGGIVLWLPRVLPGFLRWTVVVGSQTLFSDKKSGALWLVGRPGQNSEKCRTLEAWNVQDSFLNSVASWKHGTSRTVF